MNYTVNEFGLLNKYTKALSTPGIKKRFNRLNDK